MIKRLVCLSAAPLPWIVSGSKSGHVRHLRDVSLQFKDEKPVGQSGASDMFFIPAQECRNSSFHKSYGSSGLEGKNPLEVINGVGRSSESPSDSLVLNVAKLELLVQTVLQPKQRDFRESSRKTNKTVKVYAIDWWLIGAGQEHVLAAKTDVEALDERNWTHRLRKIIWIIRGKWRHSCF
ncbi:hypothetical protein Baya_12610 [Bagarius yarrelli]|uniref:Uncharacterized protein n=1 Tax=Bagarius yarrelli TaxID=175774 RepID=A0A556V401_BAGYA|nr:hypothetical protein Baya_12610 [Bagarius yarrelli]